jgi:hypothetical protein
MSTIENQPETTAVTATISPIAITLAYNRPKDLIDGTLVDVSNDAKLIGFVFPFYIHASVWEDKIVKQPDEIDEEPQSERLKYLLTEIVNKIASLQSSEAGKSLDTNLKIEYFIDGGAFPGAGEARLIVGPYYLSNKSDENNTTPTFTLIGEEQYQDFLNSIQ